MLAAPATVAVLALVAASVQALPAVQDLEHAGPAWHPDLVGAQHVSDGLPLDQVLGHVFAQTSSLMLNLIAVGNIAVGEAHDVAIFESGGRTYDVVASASGGSGLVEAVGGIDQIIDAAGLYKITAAGSIATTTTVTHLWAQQNTAAADFIIQEYGQITVLNPQSYPVVGGDWMIEFRTHGIHDLAVSAIESTTFGDYAPDDVGFVDLWCGSDSIRDATARNGVITFEDYQCHGISSLVLRVHTPGIHDLQFSFGAGMAYASNNAYPRSAVEINDSTINGPTLSNSDSFGISAAGIGDLDGDGVPDLAVGADDDDNGGTDRGAVHVMLMNRDGTVKGTIEINSSTTDGPELSNSDYFGASVAGIGDLDGDGVPDLAAGAWADDNGGDNRGAVHVMFMNRDGTVKGTAEINNGTPNGPTLSDYDFFGKSAAGIGDLDGDGVPDLAAGAWGDDGNGGTDRGAVHVMFMNRDGTVKGTAEISNGTANGPTLSDNDFFGTSVAAIGDLDGDGVPDLAAGAWRDDGNGGTDRGAVHVMLMNRDGTVNATIEINDSTTDGPELSNLDHFGVSVAGIGDLDGDGVPDLAAGASGDDEGGTNSGAVHVMLMNRDGTVKGTIEINDSTTDGPELSDGDFFGASVAGIGDLDGDGVPDLAVGADGDDNGGPSRGAVHIIRINDMKTNGNGSVDSTVEINSDTLNGPTLSLNDSFGISAAGIGDLDGDGVPDLAVGADDDDNGGTDRGAVHVMFMNRDGTVKGTVEINSSTTDGPELSNNDYFGASVAGIGDLDGDGVPDLAAGAWGDDNGGNNRGAVHVMFMNRDGTVKGTVEINNGTTNGPTLSNDDSFGGSVAGIGDLDGDGVPDLAAGAWGDDGNGGTDRGAVHVMFMNRDGTVKGTIEINSSTTNGPTLSNNDFFGKSVAAIGDLDGDGVPDLAVGAWRDDGNGGTDRGAVHVMLMNGDGTVKDTIEINSSTTNGPTLSNLDNFGISVAGIGDLDGDGVPDLAAGAWSDDNGGTDRGAVHVMFMNGNGTVKATIEINDSTTDGPTLSNNDYFGASVAGIGDLDGDGVPDLAVGADGDNNGGDNRGTVHVMYLDKDVLVRAVSSTTADGRYGLGQIVNITVKFSESVAVTGTPRLTLDVSPQHRTAPYLTGNGTDTLTFRYAPQSTDESLDLQYVAENSLSPDGGTITALESPSKEAILLLPDPVVRFDFNPPGAFGSLAQNKDIEIYMIPSSSFVTTWQTTGANETITIPGTGTYTVDWGDGSMPTSENGTATHMYATNGTYTVSISGGFTRINLGFGGLENSEKLQSIDQWGNMTWSSMKSAFEGASDMTYSATDAPDLSGVTDMSNMFVEASSFDGNLSAWNVSTVTRMESMFSKAAAFDGDVSTWDVSKVTDMSYMFAGSPFNRTLSTWDVSSVTNMESMFDAAESFDRPLNGWNVSSVTNMADMFLGASDFNQPLNGWNVSSVTSMNGMFDTAESFNQDLSTWDVSGVTDMSSMFAYGPFNQPISTWNVSKVTDMSGMFEAATKFNQPISTWNVSGVTDMLEMFLDADAFDQNLGKWYVVPDSTSIIPSDVPGIVGEISAQNSILGGHVTTYGIGTGGDMARFEIVNDNKLNMTSAVTGRNSYTANVTATGDDVFGNDNTWRTIEVTLDSTSFATTWRTDSANQTITVPVTGSSLTIFWGDGTTSAGVSGAQTHTYAAAGNHTVAVTGGLEAFTLNNHANATKLVSIDQWSNASWTTMKDAFRGANNMVYNAADSPDLSGVTDMNSMFQSSSINGDISGWDVSGVTDMSSMFNDAFAFNGNVSGWDVSGVTDMSRMFSGAPLFNGDVSGWDVSAVQDMNRMFFLAEAFNQNLNDWDVSAVTNMLRMFSGASLFNGDVSGWDVSAVQNMDRMFFLAEAFNQNLNDWDVSRVADMSLMFRDADSFNQNLGKWYVVLDDTTIDLADTGNTVGSISAQNSILNEHSPTYSLGSDSASQKFAISGSELQVKPNEDYSGGSYGITITATGTGLFGTSNQRTVGVTVTNTTQSNTPPTVDAGPAQAANEGQTVTLAGTATDPDQTDTLTYSWSQTSPASPTVSLNDPASLTTTFTAPPVTADTAFTFTLSVSDGTDTSTDTVTVTVRDVPGTNTPPTVDAGPAQAANEGQTVTLAGTATDPDQADTLTYSWSQTSPASPTVSLNDPASLTTTFTAPQVAADTAFTFTLSVSDGTATVTDTVTVTVNDRPVQTDSRSKTWTVDDMVGIMGGKGQHDLELISRCDEGTTPTGASTELHLLGLLGQASYGTFNVDMETTWVWIIEAYRLAYHYLDTGKDVISEDVYEDGITLDQYIDAAPGDVFEYPDGNYTKAQLGGMTAWSASIDWAGDGSCSLDFRQETWAP